MNGVLDPVHSTPEEFKNGGFTLKTHQMFSVHTTPEDFKNLAITDQFRFVFEENSGREITWLLWRHRFQKAAFSKCFPFTRTRKASVFKFLRFEERFHGGCVEVKLRFFKSLWLKAVDWAGNSEINQSKISAKKQKTCNQQKGRSLLSNYDWFCILIVIGYSYLSQKSSTNHRTQRYHLWTS